MNKELHVRVGAIKFFYRWLLNSITVKEKVLPLLFLGIGIACSFSFNKPSTMKDIQCEDGKYWFAYVGSMPITEDSDNSTELTSALISSNYVLITDIELCQSDYLFCAICATPRITFPYRPMIAGERIEDEIMKYISSSADHNWGLICEKE